MTKVKYILIIILCLFTVSLQAGQQQGAGAPQVVASCTTDDDSSQWEPTDESGGNYGYRLVLCDKVVLGAGITVTSYVGAIYDHLEIWGCLQ